MSKERVITQAPIQTRSDTVHKHERMFPLLVSESLNSLKEYETGVQRARVDVWNTVGRKIDLSYESSSLELTRREFVSELIDARYQIISSIYGINPGERVVIRDDDNEVVNIAKQHVGRLIDRGVFQQFTERFSSCPQCDRVIAPTAAGLCSCPDCSNGLVTVERSGLFMTMSPETKAWILSETNLNNPKARQVLSSALHNMPLIIQVSKQRAYGITLEEFGVDPRFVLDPKITLAFLPSILREMGQGELDTVILGTDSVPNFVPYAAYFDQNTQIKYISIGLIPPYSDTEIAKYEAGFYYPFLALVMTSTNGNLAAEQYNALFREYTRTIRKFDSCLTAFSIIEPQGEVVTSNQLRASLSGIIQLFSQYKTRDGVLALREFVYENLSKQYVEQCKLYNQQPEPVLLEQLNKLFNLVYGFDRTT